MTRLFWNDSQRPSAQLLLDELTCDSNEHGWIYSPSHELLFRAFAALMTRGWPNGMRVRWELLREAINRCIAKGPRTLAQVESILVEMWEGEQSLEAQARAFRVLLPVRILVSSAVSLPFDLTDTPTVRLCLDTENRAATSEPADESELSSEPVHQGPLILETTVCAASSEVALHKALPMLTACRSALNLVMTTSTIRVQFAETCRAIVAAPDRAIVVDSMSPDKAAVVPLESDGDSGFLWSGFTEWHLKEAAAFLRGSGPDAKANSIDRLLTEALRVFGLALDQPKWTFAFMLLWQTAEHLTLPKGERGNHSEVCRRLAMLRGGDALAQQRTRGALEDVERMRNDIVHGGALGLVNHSDVCFLERCCAAAIYWLHHHRVHLPTVEHLWEFYRVASAQSIQVDRQRWVLDRLALLHRP